VTNRDRVPGSGGTGASRRALLAGTGAATAAVVAGCASLSSTIPPPPQRLSVDEHVDIRDYGAVPNGPDCTSAINQALAAVSQGRASYGKIRVPKGLWRVSGTLNFGLGAGGARLSFTLEGDAPSGGGADGSVISWAPGNAGYTVLNVAGAGDVLLRNLNIGPQWAAPAAAGHVACAIDGSSWLRLENVNVYGTSAGSPAGGAAKGLVIGPCGSGSVHGCDIEAQVTAFEMGKGAISCAVTNCLFAAVRGTGGACCQMYGYAQTMQLTNVITQAGDYGVQMISDGAGIPEFLFMNNVQVNDPGITAGDFAAGSEVFANQFWAIANNLSTDLVHGLNFHPGFLGGAYFTNMNISDLGGHGIWVQGGDGYSFIGGSIGGCGSNAANSYDNVHVAAQVGSGVVTLQGLHFDTDPWMGFSSPPARSAVNVESGAVNVVAIGNIWKASGYATGPVVGALHAASGGNAAV
jgi:hypothetical protein